MNVLNIKNLKNTTILFIISILLLSLLAIMFYSMQRTVILSKVELLVENDINEYSRDFKNSISEVASDVFLLEKSVTSINTIDVIDDEVIISPHDRATIEQNFYNWLKVKRIYDQVRILDVSGQELVRVNYNGGDPVIVDYESDELQNKADRYYFYNSVELPENSLYLSKLDLNIENDVIEYVDGRPKQTLRLITPIYTEDNEQIGILIVNYLVEDLFNSFKEIHLSEYSTFEVINNKGYYVDNEKEDIEFGFMYSNKADEVFSKYYTYPLFQKLTNNVEQEIDANRLYTFTKIDENSLRDSITSTLGNDIEVYNETSEFIILGVVKITDIKEIDDLLHLTLFLGMIGILLSAVIARTYDELSFLRKQRLDMLEFSATHDVLTKLPNRLKFFEDAKYKLSRDQKFTLFFIDFDGFKNINDTHGHDIGDKVLIEGAARINKCIRHDDLLARVGGDEFIVLLNGVYSPEVAIKVAQKMIFAFEDEFEFNGISSKMGISIGITFSDKAKELETIYKEADDAMYEVKKRSKNDFYIYK